MYQEGLVFKVRDLSEFHVVNEMEPASVWMCLALIIMDAILLLAAK